MKKENRKIYVFIIAVMMVMTFCFTAEAATTDQLVIDSGADLTIERNTFDENDNLVAVQVPATSMMDWELQYAPSYVFDEYTKDGGRVSLRRGSIYMDGVEYGGYCFYSDYHILSTLSGSILWHEVSHYIFETTNSRWSSEMRTEFEALKSVFPDIYNGIDRAAYFGSMDSEFFARLSSYLYVESSDDFRITPEFGERYVIWNAPGGARETHARGRAFLDKAYELLK